MKPKSKIASFFNTLFLNSRRLNFIERIEKVVEKMSLSEKIFFYLFSVVLGISGIIILFNVNNSFLTEVPAFGGSFTEGLISSPRFINPVLAISDTDKSLVSIVYSGLLKTSEEGGLEADMASSYEILDGGLVYDFFIRDDAYFHDGKKVTADDIIFTVQKVLDPVIKSPKATNWSGVEVQKISDNEVKFILKKPYSPFLYALTLGILPKHIWENASSEEFPFSEFNINPIGSGPYKIEKVSRNSGGVLTSMTLSSWKKYTLGRPKIKTISFEFFQNETELIKALEAKSIDSAAGLSQVAAKRLINEKNVTVMKNSLPRVFGVFLNQNIAPVFLNKEIREALDMATPKNRVVSEAIYGLGEVLNGPTPASIEKNSLKAEGNIDAAKTYLLENGWKENGDGILEKKTKTGTTVFSFSISTSDTPELKKTAEILQESWSKLGASISVKIFEPGDLSQNVIKPRKYDALLFGEVIGEESDLYPFWHSSERNDPGLNVSLYTNIKVDKILEEMQKEADSPERTAKKIALLDEIKNDVPAIFLFSPYSLYAPAENVKNILLKNVSSQNERFLSINKWFIETDKVWEFFSNN